MTLGTSRDTSGLARNVLYNIIATDPRESLSVTRGFEHAYPHVMRAGRGEQGITLVSKSHVVVPGITLTVEIPCTIEEGMELSTQREDIKKALIEEEKKFILPVFDAALTLTDRVVYCDADMDPLRIVAGEAIPRMRSYGQNYKNVLCITDDLYILLAAPEEVGAFVVFQDWTPVSFGDTTAIFEGKFGCLVKADTIIGVIRRPKA